MRIYDKKAGICRLFTYVMLAHASREFESEIAICLQCPPLPHTTSDRWQPSNTWHGSRLKARLPWASCARSAVWSSPTTTIPVRPCCANARTKPCTNGSSAWMSPSARQVCGRVCRRDQRAMLNEHTPQEGGGRLPRTGAVAT